MGPKKLSKKEKARLEAEAAEQTRLELERERLRKIEEEKERQLRERREAEKRQYQEVEENRIRKKQLRDTLNYLLDLKAQIKVIHHEELVQREWESFMRCTGQPDTRSPGDLRKYIYMWIQSIKEREKIEMNWLLHTNEQSVLTQNQTIPNMSYASLRSQQPILGDYYANRLKEVLDILNELEYTISEEELSDSIMQELHELKAQFRLLLSDFLDNFSFKILLNVARDMDLEGLSVATHQYGSEHFRAQLYTTRDMPEATISNPKEKSVHDAKHIEMDFQILGVQIILPPSIKCKYSAIRGLWVDFDHFSDYCYTITNPFPLLDLRRTIRQMTKGEWKKRKEILKMVLEEILSEKPPPEENADDAEAPQPKTVLDVDKIYTEYEDDLRKEQRRNIGPEALKLDEFEVNLRSHRIIGGVYHFDYVEQPLQHVKLGPKAYLRTLPQPSKLVKKEFFQPYIPPPPVAPGVRRLPEEIEAELKMVEENLDKLVQITLQLPETVFWFEPPVVCRWEPTPPSKLAKRSRTKISIRRPPMPKVVEDFNILEVPCNNQLQTLITEFVIPKIPDGYAVKIGGLDKEVLAHTERKPLNDVEISPQLGSLIYETNAPSFLHPHASVRRILQVVSSKCYSEYSETFNREESDTTDIRDQPPEPEVVENVYMFSKFMQDLDELIENRRPLFEHKIEEEEVEEIISEPEVIEEDENQGDTNDQLALLKMDQLDAMDISQALLLSSQPGADFLKKKEPEKKEPEPETDEESEDEEEESVEDLPRKVYQSKQISGKWMTDEIHDVKYNEDKLQMQFRVGKLGAFGFAVPRYSNIPFQGWELKPDLKNPNSLIFSVTASIMTAEWTIMSDGIKLNALQGGTTNAINDYIGKVYPIKQMIKILRSVSCDIFPDDDAFYYVDSSCEKNAIMEFHLYSCMGIMCSTHNFSWSRWNQHVGSRTCVLLMREIIEHRKLPHFGTLMITPLKACIVDCTEVGAAFSATPSAGMDYYSDLNHLNKATSPPATLEKQEKMCPKLRHNATLWLKSMRPLSFA